MTVYTLTRFRRKTLAIHIKPDDRSPAGSMVSKFSPQEARRKRRIKSCEEAPHDFINTPPLFAGFSEVRAPLKLAKSEIERFVTSKSAWIAKKQAEIAARQPTEPRELPPSQYAPGEFECVARKLIRTWEQRLGVTVSFVGFRRMSTRWGSCTAKTRRIRLNAALAYCPQECLEYVIIHELAHIRENNHSSRFWTLIADALPDYKARQTKLKSVIVAA